MHLNGLTVFLADATPATTTGTAPAAGSPATPQQGLPPNFFFIIAVFGVMMYFLFIRPQSQQRKKQMQLLEALKPGDKIVTHSGIHGVVITVKDKTASIRSHESKLEVAKSSITEILERGGEEKSEKSA